MAANSSSGSSRFCATDVTDGPTVILTQSGPRSLIYGMTQKANHGLPMWISGKIPAHITAKIVIASADLLTDVLQR